MGAWIARWFYVTLRLNPIFPLSALALLVGTYLLVQSHSLGGGLGQTVMGIALFECFELCLLGVAVFALWPRRISYETVTILVMRGALRFAPPFLLLGLAAKGELTAALSLGLGVFALEVCKGELANLRLDLEIGWRARLYDYALGAGAFLLPLLVDRIPLLIAERSVSNVLQLGVWWVSALALLPLALGVDGLGAGGPEKRGRHTVAGRCVTFGCFAGLAFNSLLLGATPPFGLAFVPLLLVTTVFVARLAPQSALPRILTHVPSLLAAGAVVAPPAILVGEALFAPHLSCCAVILLLAAGSVPLISPRHPQPALRTLALVAVLAPLRFLGAGPAGEAYLLGLAGVGLALGLHRQSSWLTALGGCASATLGGHLGWTLLDPGVFFILLAFAGIPAGTALAIRNGRHGDSLARLVNASGADETGVICPYCRDALGAEGVVGCSECATTAHTACAQQHGGCVTYGCGAALAEA
jgi:hypothetical protein